MDDGKSWSAVRLVSCGQSVCPAVQLCPSSLLASPQAVGVFLATGNEGPYLLENSPLQNTYISIDNGNTWTQTLKGAFQMAVADQGGLILAAPTQAPSTEMLYSWDLGISFTHLEVFPSPVTTLSIEAEPLEIATTFMVVAASPDGNHVLASLDFD